ncbi:MAG: hypothetical protein H6Q58_1153 [Firmicutes bacterium]|nr:hypothetical protein [Bacillota bacterium]
MGHIDAASVLEERLYSALLREEYDEFKELLAERETLYRSFAGQYPKLFRDWIGSEAFDESRKKITGLYNSKKESLLNEMQELDRSRKAAEGYMGSTGNAPNIFSRSV